MGTVKNKGVFLKVKEIREDIDENYDKYSEKEVNRKINEVSNILQELREIKKKGFYEKNRYKMRNLYMKVEK